MMCGKRLNRSAFSAIRNLLEARPEHGHIASLFNHKKELTHSSQTSRGAAKQIKQRAPHQ